MGNIQGLIKQILTKEDLILVLEDIETAKGLIFKEIEVPLSKKIKGRTREEFRDWLKRWEKENPKFKSPEEQFTFLEKLKKELEKIPQVKLEIAFEPSRSFLLRIREWFKKETGKEIILDVTKNLKIVGGVVIEWQGKYINLSLAKKIEEIFSQK